MTILILITYKLRFSNEIVSYFKEQNICNTYNFNFLPVGLDEGPEEKILNTITNRLRDIRNLNNVIIFSDVGLPTKLAKRIEVESPDIKLFRAKGSLVENGFLTYIMLNTKAPIETIDNVMNDIIEK